jgi:hypothetical protein
MAPSIKSTWIIEKKESNFEEFNELAEVLFPKKEGSDKLLLHHDFSFAVLSRYIKSVPTTKQDGTVARKFVIWFRMYLQTKQNITQANTPTDRRLALADIETRLRVSNLTEWVPYFPFRTSDPDPYTIVHGVYGGADKTFCVGTLRTKGQNKNPPKKNEVIVLDTDDLPTGSEVASYDGVTEPYKRESSQLHSPRRKNIKVEKKDVMIELPPVINSKRMAAKRANTKIVKQKKRDKKHETEEVESVIESGSELSTESTVQSSKSGSKKRLSSTESGDISSSTSSDSDDSDSSDEPKKKKRTRSRSKKNRQKKEKKRKSSERQKEHEIITTPKKKDIPSKKDTVVAVTTKPTCCNKDCKITEKYIPVNYGCDTCHGQFHWDCLHDAHTCISCSAAADPTGIEPAESIVAVVETPSVTPVKTSAGGKKKVLKPLVDHGSKKYTESWLTQPQSNFECNWQYSKK